jgi:uncharacterized protein YndB with AHSA1/START domain
MNPIIKQIVVEVPINAPKERVWDALVKELPDWWPKDFMGLPNSEKMKWEPWPGGRLFEETADGHGLLWGQVLSIMPGASLEMMGAVSPTWGGPSINMNRMEVQDAGSGTTLFRLTNSVLGNLSEEGEQNVTEGWKYLFAMKFKEYVEGKA